MKIAIVTVHDSANFGSYLQAYALWSYLSQKGHVVFFVQTRGKHEVLKIFLGNRTTEIIKNLPYNLRRYLLFAKNQKKLPIKKSAELEKEKPDLLILGSDTLWNVKAPVFRNKYFYGIGLAAKFKMAYAISVGNSHADDLKKYPLLVEGIEKLDTIMPRDEATKEVVEALCAKETIQVCDPTLLVEKNIFQIPYVNKVKEPYLAVYSYAMPIELIDIIKQYVKEKGLITVSVCMKQAWCDKHINCAPLDFCKVLDDAQCVVTTTFHGTIFSILNHKRFVTYSSKQKVKDITEKVGLEKQVISEFDYLHFQQCLEKEIDYSEVDKKIESYRKNSTGLLDNYLQKVELAE